MKIEKIEKSVFKMLENSIYSVTHILFSFLFHTTKYTMNFSFISFFIPTLQSRCYCQAVKSIRTRIWLLKGIRRSFEDRLCWALDDLSFALRWTIHKRNAFRLLLPRLFTCAFSFILHNLFRFLCDKILNVIFNNNPTACDESWRFAINSITEYITDIIGLYYPYSLWTIKLD